MPAGYSGTPLAKKLGIKLGTQVVAIGAPASYQELLEPLPDGVEITETVPGSAAFLHFFTIERAALEREFPRLKDSLLPDGILWISWPKKASKVKTDVDGNVVRGIGLANGLVDVKVCAVDETWSGLKFVYRVADR